MSHSRSADTPVEAPRTFPVTNTAVLAIAVPMTLAFVTTPLLGLVDTAVVGRLGVAAQMGGLAVGAVLFDVVFSSLNFMRASTTGLVAQAMGRDDEKEQTAVLARALLLALALGALTFALGDPILSLGLALVAPTPAVAEAVTTYFAIRIMAAPLTLANYALLGWTMGLARSGLGLALQVVLNGTNIVLSLYLGLHLGWGIAGVAWATVIAEGVGVAAGLLAAAFLLRGTDVPSRTRILEAAAFGRLFALNRDIMIRSFCLLGAFFAFTALGSRFGEVTLAANAVLMNFFMIAGFFLDGMATASEQLAGRAVGARWRAGFDRAVALTLRWGWLLGGGCTLLFLVAGPWLIDLITVNETVREAARAFLPYAAATGIVGTLAFQMDGVYIGATWSRTMRDMMLISVALYGVAAAFALWIGSNHLLWIALLIFLGARGITLWRRLPRLADQTFPAPA